MVRKPRGRPPRVPPELERMRATAWSLRETMRSLVAIHCELQRLISPPRDPFGEAEAMLRGPDPLDSLGIPDTDELAELLGL